MNSVFKYNYLYMICHNALHDLHVYTNYACVVYSLNSCGSLIILYNHA